MDTINVDIVVNQIEDGRVYSGKVVFGGVRLDYVIDFNTPVGQLLSSKLNYEKLCEETTLHLRHKDREIIPDEYEKAFVMVTAGKSAIEFYNDPSTRKMQEGFSGRMLREGLLGGEIQVVDGQYFGCKMPKNDAVQRILKKYSTL